MTVTMAMSSAAFGNHGFETATHLDHRAWVWVAGILSLAYSMLCLAARTFGKWGLLWYDDIVLGLGYLTAVVHWALLYRSTFLGLAVSSLALSPQAMDNVAKMYFASRIPWFMAHALAKLSILVFTRRIFAGDIYNETLVFRLSYAFVIAYGIVAVLLSSAGCDPTQAVVAAQDAVCPSNGARWTALTALDGLTEVVILAMPIWFISKNQLKSSKKRIVIFVYMFRLIVIAFTAATTVSYFNFLNHGNDNISIAPVIAWQESLLSFSLISASFPCLRSFIWAFMSRGLMTMYGNTTVSGSHGGSRGASIHLRSFNKSHVSRADSEAGESRFRLRPEQVAYRVDVTHGLGKETMDERTRRGTDRSDDSDRMIIHQETSYRVESTTV